MFISLLLLFSLGLFLSFLSFTSSLLLLREDGDFDNINSPYFVFYLVKGAQNSVLPPIVLVQSQVEHFSLSNENDVLDVRFMCTSYDFDILVTMTQIS